MRWQDQRMSDNVEDRRGMSGKGLAFGGGGCGLLIVILLAVLCGADPQQLLQNMPSQDQVSQPQVQQNQAQHDEQEKFARAILGSTEDAWSGIFQKSGVRYRMPKLVLFTDMVQSACGNASAATGPFYCPGDEKLYLDFAFFDELKREFKAPGDFAQAYVIAHEVGHHIQNLTGTMDKVNQLQQRSNEARANQLSVRLELQADCYAGIWASYAQKKGLVEAGDPEEAIRAAAAVGDDMIQKRTQGYVVPESFTHGSAQDRMKWFAVGFKAADLRQCDTFR